MKMNLRLILSFIPFFYLVPQKSCSQETGQDYYMHVYLKNGKSVGYNCIDIDSVTFTKGFADDLWCNNFDVIDEEINPNLTIHEGYISNKADTIRIVRNGETKAIVLLGKPIMVAQAENVEGWGHYQFPKIFRVENGNLIVKWQMKDDSHTTYGEDKYGRMTSSDEGATWGGQINFDYFEKDQYRVELKNGDILQVKEPASKDINEYSSFPSPVNAEPIGNQKYSFYRESELPEELRGVYFEYWDKSKDQTTAIHGLLNDSGYLRYSIENLMPIVWRGDIKELEDGKIVAVVYPCFYQNTDGKVLRCAVSTYNSTDAGKNWNFIGKIPYQEGDKDIMSLVYDGGNGFTEPTFEVLKDGSYICVMRNYNWNAPLCKSFSRDGGYTWSAPEPFTPNGVKPRLMLLGNNTLVLTSGRPGLQLRFSVDGDGQTWTEPIDMMSFIDEDGKYSSDRETCGYSDLLAVDENTFYMVYSDFRTLDKNGDYRKSIIFRKVEVIKK